jgi:hypothetical protein
MKNTRKWIDSPANSRLFKSLTDRGYAPSAPSIMRDTSDRMACRFITCRCGKMGLFYRPFYKQETGKYKAYAYCGKCHHATRLREKEWSEGHIGDNNEH